MEKFDFNGLFILDLANNHQGDVVHGQYIIRELGKVLRELRVRAAIKFQFRQLETFIHPDYRNFETNKHIKRFLDTNLSIENYNHLVEEARKENFITMCTPFDEESVDLIEQMDFDAIKIASCSLNDSPLLNRIVTAKMPVVASTGGVTIDDVDRIFHLFERENIHFALEHCISIYPTPIDQVQLNQIEYLRSRYPNISIGWSTHEDPDDTVTVQLAYAKGATLFERHVGIETSDYNLNAYSSTPSQVRNWMLAYGQAMDRCGAQNRPPSSQQEMEATYSLKRGIYAKTAIAKDSEIRQENVFFAMPTLENGMTSGNWVPGLVANKDYGVGEILSDELVKPNPTNQQIIDQIMLMITGMLREARISIGNHSRIEISHHFGLKRFREYGAVIIDVINREYCKKLIVQLPRQKHPYHFHKKKEETFQVLFGELEGEKDGNPFLLYPGDIFLIEPNCWHKFSTLGGVIFEEISTTHFDNDSYYLEKEISRIPRESRKTVVENWSY